ncbi:MAG: family 10 glycosylhydrolase, partial [Victivallaceae bacterium]
DTRGWVKKGYLDYIVPQIYWPFGHEVAAYAALVDWWSQQVKGTGTDLYIGIAAYQAGSSSLWNNPDELYNQLRYDRKYPEVKGEVFFSCRSILAPRNPVMRNALSRIYQRCWIRPALVP